MSIDHKAPETVTQPITEELSPLEKIAAFCKKHAKALGAGAVVLATGITAAVVTGMGSRETENAIPDVHPTPAASAPETPGVSTPTPEATASDTPTPETNKTQTTTPNTEAQNNEKEAIEAALAFAEAPLEQRQAEFMAMATKALNATDANDPFMSAFSETAGDTGAVLASYNPAYHPGEADDTAVQIFGQTQFSKQLPPNIELQDQPGKLDKATALKVLAGTYYKPLLSSSYPITSGIRNKTYGILNEEEIRGPACGSSQVTGISFDEKSTREFPQVLDASGNVLPLRVVEFETPSQKMREINVLVNGQWVSVDDPAGESRWGKVKQFWKTTLGS